MTETSRPPLDIEAVESNIELRKPRWRVERRAIALWTLTALTWTAVGVGGLGAGYAIAESYRWLIGPVLVVAAIVAAVNVTVMPTVRYLVHRWEYTDGAVCALKGWVIRQWRVAPISRIQSVDNVRGPLEQMLGLATLKVTTASREGGISIPGLAAHTAADTVQRLTHLTERVPGDAT